MVSEVGSVGKREVYPASAETFYVFQCVLWGTLWARSRGGKQKENRLGNHLPCLSGAVMVCTWYPGVTCNGSSFFVVVACFILFGEGLVVYLGLAGNLRLLLPQSPEF